MIIDNRFANKFRDKKIHNKINKLLKKIDEKKYQNFKEIFEKNN